jgi:hypothetical protein
MTAAATALALISVDLATLLAASSSSISGVICVSSHCSDVNRLPSAAALQVPMHPVKSIPRNGRPFNMLAERTKDLLPVYSYWFGKPVVMLVLIRQFYVPMPCHIIGESAADVRVRIQPGWEMDVRKDLILAVEEVVIAAEDHVN